MSLEAIGLLVCLGAVAFILLSEIRRVQRALEESVRADQHAIAKIPDLENQVRTLTKAVEHLQKQR
jgi:TolA-binding protein